ncbi:MAG: hypothetical protein ACE5FS_10110, partial [Paracoccaceae bacterium]
VMAVPRCGSSMVAGAFARHGAWVGTCRGPDRFNERGYFENIHMRVLLQRYGKVLEKEPPDPDPEWIDGVKGILAKDGYSEGPWLFKMSAMYHKLWEPFGPTFVVPRRPPESVIASIKSSRIVSGDIETIVHRHEALMSRLEGFHVDTPAVAKGDLTTLEEAIKGCGLKFDESVKGFISPGLWHY